MLTYTIMTPENKVVLDGNMGGEEKIKKVKKAARPIGKKAEVKPAGTTVTPRKDENYLFTLVIVAIVILGIIGLVFGYTKDKITEIKQGGTEMTKGLEQEVANLKQQLSDISEKADSLEKDNNSNKEVVLDMFEKAREIPTKVDVAGWNQVADKTLSFSVFYPQTWEAVKPVMEATPAKEGETKQAEIVYLQPTGNNDFLNVITIKSDYADFANLSLTEKVDIFKELELIDTYKFDGGRMLYFINVDKDKTETPTILILTDKNIYRATFNVPNKKLTGYFEYRKNFEEIVATFALVVPEKKK